MNRTMLYGLLAAAIGVGAASAIAVLRKRNGTIRLPEKSIDNLVDYCQNKVDQLDNLLKGLPKTAQAS